MISKSLPNFISLPNHDGNQQPISVQLVDSAVNIKQGDDHGEMRPTDKPNTHWEVA